MKKFFVWLIAFVITISAALYQRRTGPTYPLEGRASLNDSVIRYTLERSHEVEEDYEITIRAENRDVEGYVLFKRYKTDDPLTTVSMVRRDDFLTARLPHQPAAGKLEYKVILTYQEKETSLSGENPVIIRFKGRVPLAILIIHVIIMFMAMLISNRAGLEALNSRGNPRKFALWTAGLLLVGGFILGPLVQNFAFGNLWTGFPLGFDLTDNKTLIAMVGWIAAVIAGRRGKPARWWVLGAAILLLVVYLIPHSLLGSELDYSKMGPSSLS
jgi:hypothetical protein